MDTLTHPVPIGLVQWVRESAAFPAPMGPPIQVTSPNTVGVALGPKTEGQPILVRHIWDATRRVGMVYVVCSRQDHWLSDIHGTSSISFTMEPSLTGHQILEESDIVDASPALMVTKVNALVDEKGVTEALRYLYGVLYGVLYDGRQFTRDGVLELGAAAHGLTCATFVMHVFRSAGIELLEWAAWPIRTTDADWHQQIVSELEKFWLRYPDEISEEHINNVRGELGCARFRPEEVMGACSSTECPTSFDFAVAAGREICEVLFN